RGRADYPGGGRGRRRPSQVPPRDVPQAPDDGEDPDEGLRPPVGRSHRARRKKKDAGDPVRDAAERFEPRARRLVTAAALAAAEEVPMGRLEDALRAGHFMQAENLLDDAFAAMEAVLEG